jgi:serine/threonine-protein kinase HipA
VTALPGFTGFATNVAIDKLQRSEALDSYATVAKAAGISPRIAMAAVKQTVELAKERWPSALKDMEVPPAVEAEILGRLETLPLANLK